MLTSSRFNYLIEITQNILGAISEMRQCYAAFPKLVDEEHAMIQAHRYTVRLEEICKEKIELSEIISQNFSALHQLAHQVFIIWGELECEGSAVFPGDISNCIHMLDSIHATASERQSE